ncbi:glucosamine-6-phosphate isomerase [Plectosphaerella plurivora]|uniref:Glucosamine-6-phosphate isomerase n=1 Tax=Plectosphaerella plurivora TaxID=936078 RepID=A0A9P9A8X5_9PEZI|nr:glucosamine-6-phosphate isomerase [Plectosphaerella plurivora]
MRLIIRDDAEASSAYVANYVVNRIKDFAPTADRPFVLGLPTGSSPMALYKQLVEMYKAGKISFENVVTFNMDEYVGIPRDHPQSYHTFMWRHLFSHINIPPQNVHILNGNAPDLEEECAAYEAAIVAAGGIDLFLAGIGADGHIAFNEPGSSLASRTRVKTLAYDTVLDNARFFGDDISQVPRLALTVGVRTVLDAREVVTIVLGARKAVALQKCVEGGVNHMWTLSSLQQHQHAMIVADEDATLELQVKTVRYFKSIEKVALAQGFEQNLPVALRSGPSSPVGQRLNVLIPGNPPSAEVVIDEAQSPVSPIVHPQPTTPSLLRANGPAINPLLRSVSPDLIPDRMASRIPEPTLQSRLTPNPEQQSYMRIGAVGA